MPGPKIKPVEVRFWPKVNKTDSCWLWTGRISNGYGSLNLGGTNGGRERAHRLSWVMHYGSIPEELVVAHHCDVPLCVRPDHLFLTTNGGNIVDMWQKGRQRLDGKPHGSAHHRAKLTEDQVRAIRTRYAAGGIANQALATEFGVSKPTIQGITSGREWKHI